MAPSVSRLTLVPVPENRDPPDFRRGLEMNYVYRYASCPAGMVAISFYRTDGRVRSLSKRGTEKYSIIFIAFELKQLKI